MRLSFAATLLFATATPALAHGPADLAVPFSAPANFTAHAKMFQERVTRVGTTPVWQIEFQGMNVVVIEGTDGLILVDTGMNKDVANAALAKIRAQISAKPIKAIIYTHHHPDHVHGASVFANPADVASGKVPIFAASNFLKELSDEGIATLPIVATRAAYMFGFSLTGDEAADYHVGCCGGLNTPGKNESGYIPPTQFVEMDGARDVEIAGVKLHLFHTGGEAASHIAVWLPEHKVLVSGDEVQGPTFPNLHSMRGTKMRDANRWIAALRRMQAYDSAYMVPLHGPVVTGAPKIKALLAGYEDAIQYTHDQAIRHINMGSTVADLPEAVGDLPPYLRSEPYTTEYYGTVADAVRSYYVGYVSWFSGDATDLDPTPRPERARREVELMGGRARVLATATDAFTKGDAQWAAELTTLLIAIDHQDMDARKLKAAAFRKLGYATYNSNRRGFYLMGALELEGKINPNGLTARYMNPDNIKKMPVPLMLEQVRYRVDPAKAGDRDVSVALSLPGQAGGAADSWVVELRNATLKSYRQAAPAGMPVATLDRAALGELVAGAATVDVLAKRGAISGNGAPALSSIFNALDLKPAPISLVVR
ncbi:Alkyl sulfatase BDS1, metallo-beta-lactamase superfamily [Sphingomonas laterariae]|uniref:Alkyl sulfatase BDS1, metallo-beta-lactamase superfamily n=1 Tax=Edaphosphingomonas laterariae TaxID=861865 RepID=A0A239G440_9SPHN|nr:alkyl sulfatase dimerization domain-containing protein [Sphingomonas laterariae]SNS63775.1 Alkyl sulfatase BDS1, metallo-beta-lactamase superfamily [Sphingomonas laterariae]